MVLYLVIVSADRETLCYAGTILDTIAKLAQNVSHLIQFHLYHS